MIKINIELDETVLKQLILEHFETLINCDLKIDDIKIQVKSKQNYKSEWEDASFKAIVNKLK